MLGKLSASHTQIHTHTHTLWNKRKVCQCVCVWVGEMDFGFFWGWVNDLLAVFSCHARFVCHFEKCPMHTHMHSQMGAVGVAGCVRVCVFVYLWDTHVWLITEIQALKLNDSWQKADKPDNVRQAGHSGLAGLTGLEGHTRCCYGCSYLRHQNA